MTKRAYVIEVDGRLITINISDYLGVEGIQAIRRDIEAILAKGRGSKDMLAKVVSQGPYDAEARREAAKFVREVPLRRIAVVGIRPHLIRAANAVLRAGGKGDRLKLFRNEEDARAWLASKKFGAV